MFFGAKEEHGHTFQVFLKAEEYFDSLYCVRQLWQNTNALDASGKIIAIKNVNEQIAHDTSRLDRFRKLWRGFCRDNARKSLCGNA